MQGSLAERLRLLRAERGLTLKDAGALLGVDRHTLRRIELGVQEPLYPTLKKLAEGYGVPVEDLLESEAPKAEAPPSPAEPADEERRAERRAEREEAAEVLAEQVAADFARYPEFLEDSDTELLRGALLDAVSRSYWLLDVLCDEIASTREPSSDLKQARETAREASRHAASLYDQWRALGRVPGRPREARPDVRRSPTGPATTEGSEQGNLNTEAGAS